MPTNVTLETDPASVKSGELEEQAAHEAAEAALKKIYSHLNERFVFRRQHGTSDVSLELLTTKLKKVKSRLVKVTVEKLEFSTA